MDVIGSMVRVGLDYYKSDTSSLLGEQKYYWKGK